MSIFIPQTTNNGGANIIGYELWVDDGNNFLSAFHQITNYSGLTTSYIASNADGLVIGKTYRFKSRVFNIIGYSEFSTESYIAFGDVPFVPDAPTRLSSSETSIEAAWLPPLAGDLSIAGYILSVDDGRNTDLLPVYIGSNRPDVLRFVVGNLTKGLPYRFSVQAINENGVSA